MRHIPATMATQHPDNSHAPFWETDGDGFVNVQEEVEECHTAFRDLGCEEYMWDWEGKYVDEAVMDKLFSSYHTYFTKHQIGKDKFLTFRLPNIWQEKGYSLARAMMGILTSESFAGDLGFYTPPLFEVILPMTSDASQLIYIQKTFTKLAHFKNKVFGSKKDKLDYVEIIPIFEGVDDLTSSKRLLEKYLELHKKAYRRRPAYLRPFIARSDPSLNAGQVPATLASKVALSDYAELAKEKRIGVYPIIGAGSLVFRGGLSPDRINDFMKEYPGVTTATIQSAFRYDYPLADVKKAIRKLNSNLSKIKPVHIAQTERTKLKNIIKIFKENYQKTIEGLASDIDNLSRFVPRRRERKLHIGLFGYTRKIGKTKLPRAIPFTASLYSLGVPPELIGTGRGLRALNENELELLETHYVNFKKDLLEVGKYLNKENLDLLAKKSKAWAKIKEDVEVIEDYLEVELGPRTMEEYIYRNFASNAYLLWKGKKDISQIIVETGKIRRSLG